MIFNILKNLYTNRNPSWIKQVNDVEIQPFLIQRWLCMNDKIRVQTRWLDKYVFVLPPKMYLSLAWSILPKVPKTPFVKYIKKEEETEEFDFILSQVRKHFQLSDNDFNSVKERVLVEIKKDMVNWFSYYGIKKKYWKQNQLDFRKIKEYGEVDKMKAQTGLGAFG